ncbi:T9SS type A sorting domain-containing protein [Neolewinella aurantiaca]|uniref:T9SS type A sorting domain-containing protein n=1 Tax=Neolewinella aurantiaca TaxID=2602767 RepID=A0A5C7FY19_9BACT|nr:proprotein convertase P-domain-containing protein [Neolewinella aurantiaca]TXF91403.1 T9SS type A sorting domain-containing protein [Neolewinella aurantiaca]
MRTLLLFFTLLSLLSATTLLAQPQPVTRPSSVPTLALPALDNTRLLQEELSLRKPGRAPRFAEVRQVSVRPETDGVWQVNNDGTTTWRLRISSPNAESINLGFTEFSMPRGGELYLHTGKKDNWEVRGPYTPADNEVHNQLWTPVINGDEVVVEVTLPEEERSNLRLWLTEVNHDFLGFTENVEKSGSCNVDVICGDADGYAIVDKYRDIIRSVVVYSIGGGTFCTGFLVNNTSQDGTPYFMTADHCNMTAANAPSLVTYYNFENSTCRPVGSAASGGAGDGVLGVNNTGAIFRASNPASDMTLLELDDPIPAAANAFLAGWDNSYDVPTDTMIAIHHPSTDEKRISFTFQQTFFTAGYAGNNAPTTGTHLEVPDWDIGTTEPGSSGSPIFDRFHRVRGQLHGGQAACGNNSFDTYGAVARSWEGGGSSSTRLRDWLDPNNTGVSAIDGREVNVAPSTIVATPSAQSACGTDQVQYSLAIGSGFTSNVTLSIGDLPAGLGASYSQNPAAPGSTVTLTVGANTPQTGEYDFTVMASDGSNDDSVPLNLTLTAATPGPPTGITPAHNETDVSLTPTIQWSGTGMGDYLFEIALDPSFTNTVFTGTLTTEEFTPASPLEQSTTYYWIVQEVNECGAGQASIVHEFTTLVLACGGPQQSADVPVTIAGNGTSSSTSDLVLNQNSTVESIEVSLDVSHTYVGDLRISLEGPNGTSAVLVDRIGRTTTGFGCGGDNLVLTFSDMAASTSAALEATCNNEPAASGTYQPVDALSVFAGVTVSGTWQLVVEDLADGDGGTLNNWSLTICTADAALPVELISFGGTGKDCSYTLDWTVEREEGFSHYEVERSTDGRTFSFIGQVESGRQRYTFVDELAQGHAYYRLKLIDLDGSFAYSALVAAQTECNRNSLISLYPNPVDKANTLQLDFNNPLTTGTSFTVFGADGRAVFNRSATGIGNRSTSLELGELPAGTYYLRIVSGGQAEVRSFVKM